MIYYNGRDWKESRVEREREKSENEIYPVRWYRVFGLILEQLLKIHKKSKIDTYHKYMYMHQEKL